MCEESSQGCIASMSGNRVAEINPEDHPTVCGMQKIAADLLPVPDPRESGEYIQIRRGTYVH
jgi:hypothetical protein